MAELPYYSVLSNSNKFFNQFKKGDLFKFSEIFSFESVRKRAERRCIIIEKCDGETNIVKVICNRLKDPQTFHFDEELIDN